MNQTTKLAVLAAGLALATRVWADADHKMPMPQASKELEQVKQLAGTWKGTSQGHDGVQPVTVEYRVTSAGSAVEEVLMKGTPHEMVDMYTDEGGKLTMTHYCAMGNHPHLLMKEAAPGKIALAMGPTPGIRSKDDHMDGLTLEFADANHLTQRWHCFKDGKAGPDTVLTLTREKT